ncbi:MAG: hypothetical protein ACRCVT_13975, partial [Leadbetterella sp.]
EFVKTESYKVDKIKKGWVGIKIFWTVPIILGLILIFVSQTRFLNGIAIGCLIMATIGHIEEMISYQHNEKYRLEIKNFAKD